MGYILSSSLSLYHIRLQPFPICYSLYTHTVTRLSHDLADAEQLFNGELAVGQQFLALHL